jgi:hypothetical protein
MSVCKSCGAPIRWAKSLSGRAMPLDEKPNPKGNILLLPSGGAMVVTDTCHHSELFTSHFATCPQANQHRSKS